MKISAKFIHILSLSILSKAYPFYPSRHCCLTSLVVIVFFSISRQIGHMSSLCRLLGDIAISVSSVMAS